MNRCPATALGRLDYYGKGLLQAVFIMGLWQLGEIIVRAASLPVPGAVMGLFILLALLTSKRLKIGMIRKGAEWFLAEMLLFFVPAVLVVLDYPDLIGLRGIKIVSVIVLSTLSVMVITGTVVEVCYRLSATRKSHADAA